MPYLYGSGSISTTRRRKIASLDLLNIISRAIAVVLLFGASVEMEAQSVYNPAGTISTLAGGTRSGSANGTGTTGQFDVPTGVTSDAAGNIYVADTFNQTIRKITPAGVTTTLAGSAPNEGSVDGNGAAARFFFPAGVAADSAGNLFVTDGKNTIRKVSPSGAVSTFAGTAGTTGSADGTGAAASFKNPNGIAVDGAGNIVVADSFNQTVRRISPTGVVTTLAGSAGAVGSADGNGAAARFNFLHGVAVDDAGNVYVSDRGNHLIRKISPSGDVSTIAGAPGTAGSTDGVGAAARFDNPTGIAVDAGGNVYVSDSGNHTIRRIDSNGIVTTLAGAVKVSGFVDGVGSAARFSTPYGLAFNPSGELLIAGGVNPAIRKAVIPGGTPPTSGLPTPTGLVSRISNVSVRTTLAASQTLIVGFTMQGGAKSLLLRAVGPGLATFGVSGTMSDPICALFKGSSKLEENDNWGGSATLSAAFASVGGFPLSGGSLDAALIRSIDGGHTAQISGVTAGTVLVEAYDAGAGLSPRLVNISARNRVGSGSDVLIAGFTIAGSGPKNVLVRAVGPTLGGFGVAGFLADPKLEVYTGANKVAENNTWAQNLAGVFTSVGAFPLSGNSKDAALTLTLQPGGYTVQVSGADGGTGEALIEIYELP
jgi:sugar lactone lactonase YvrE